MVRHVPARYACAVTHRSYRFDRYTISPATRELRCDGALVPLSPIVFDCIAWLLEHRDRAVGRDELVAAVWGRADVADTQVVQAVLKARRAVGDTGEEQRVIRTIPRFGYRWVAEVDADEADAPRPAIPPRRTPASEGAPPAPLRAGHARGARLAAVAAALLLAAGAWWFGGSLLRQPAGPQVPQARPEAAASQATAVLPATVAAGRDWSWLRLGLMDLVADRLRDAGVVVVPSDAIVALAGEASDAESAERVMRAASSPRWTVLPSVQHGPAGWSVGLQLRDGAAPPRGVDAVADDPASAAREAARRLLALLGRDGAGDTAAGGDLVPRLRAALLANDFGLAQATLDAATPAQRALPEVRLLQAQTDFGRGRYDIAHDGFTRLLGELGEDASPLLRARILNGRAACSIRLMALARAESDFGQALALIGDRNEPAIAGQTYSGRGAARAMQGDADGAYADFARARIALRLAGDTLALARVELNEGALRAQRGHPADALASFGRAADEFERSNARNELAGALVNQVEAYLDLLEPAQALAVAERAQALAPRLDDRAAGRLIAYWHASALAAVGRLAEAHERLDALIRAPEVLQDPVLLAMSRARKAALSLAAGQVDSAAAVSWQVVDGGAGGPLASVRGDAWLTLARALSAQDRADEAGREVARFDAWARASGDESSMLYARLAQAEAAWSERRREAAAAAYADALALAEQAGVPLGIARVGVSWGTVLIAEGELEAAAQVVGRLARWSATDFACALLQARLYRALGHVAAWRETLEHARSLAGERAIPAAVADERPATPLIAG
ncbi:DNA-binding winged helix-turn-helix (wHTH) protein [Dokdonella fugitiva]|uniref:DNA-binding winged helix-turn-helix (WHTH) protein n=1 Tax=Dokdonella fugitiva TaxID=328517 RepID=A0A4R2IE52_9GAMM|nr:DNA-binding winged helix-turn-helix (wHTH) protein [Dokdonella fugitiva]